MLEPDTFSNLAIQTAFSMFGVTCDIAFRADFALELINNRLYTHNPSAMYKLIVIGRRLNSQSDEEKNLATTVRMEMS